MNDKKSYILDYRNGGGIGPMRIINLNIAMSESDWREMDKWLQEKLLRNDREISLSDYKEEELETTPDTSGIILCNNEADHSESTEENRLRVAFTQAGAI